MITARLKSRWSCFSTGSGRCFTARPLLPTRATTFSRIWRALWPHARPGRLHWTLRDYHSPNLLWLPDRQDTARVGLIDTQDAVLGHPAYDLASLLQDARVKSAPEVATDLLDYYCAYRSAAEESDFDEQEFRRAFVILSTQRITKILGIFARLSKRDGKHQYLRHIGKLNRYLETNLKDPVLADLRRWYDTHLPLALREKLAGSSRRTATSFRAIRQWYWLRDSASACILSPSIGRSRWSKLRESVSSITLLTGFVLRI